jgi:hypothetical protein
MDLIWAPRPGQLGDLTRRPTLLPFRCVLQGPRTLGVRVAHAAQEPERTFLQGLIQVAGAFHHFQRGNYAGAISLLRSALGRLDRYPAAFTGIAVSPLCMAIRRWLEALETIPRASPPPVPQLRLAGRGSPS